jgi:hypothetical protein
MALLEGLDERGGGGRAADEDRAQGAGVVAARVRVELGQHGRPEGRHAAGDGHAFGVGVLEKGWGVEPRGGEHCLAPSSVAVYGRPHAMAWNMGTTGITTSASRKPSAPPSAEHSARGTIARCGRGRLSGARSCRSCSPGTRPRAPRCRGRASSRRRRRAVPRRRSCCPSARPRRSRARRASRRTRSRRPGRPGSTRGPRLPLALFRVGRRDRIAFNRYSRAGASRPLASPRRDRRCASRRAALACPRKSGGGPGAAARAVAGRPVTGHILAIDRSGAAIAKARAATADQIASGRMSVRHVAVEDFVLQADEEPTTSCSPFESGPLTVVTRMPASRLCSASPWRRALTPGCSSTVATRSVSYRSRSPRAGRYRVS